MGGRTKKDQKVSVKDWLPLSSDTDENTVKWQPTTVEEYQSLLKKSTRFSFDPRSKNK